MIERIPKLFLQILQNRLQLLSLELREEKVRVKQQITLNIVGATFGVTGFLGLAILIIYLLPTENRVLVASIIIAILIISGVVLLLVARGLSHQHKPFEATLAALEKDIYKS